jgi:membrane protein implicated in regulation of membrane protease activity
MLDAFIRLCDAHQRLLVRPWVAVPRAIFDGLCTALVIAFAFMANSVLALAAALAVATFAIVTGKTMPYRVTLISTVSIALVWGWWNFST